MRKLQHALNVALRQLLPRVLEVQIQTCRGSDLMTVQKGLGIRFPFQSALGRPHWSFYRTCCY